MAIRECDCKEFQDSGHTDECNKHYKPGNLKGTVWMSKEGVYVDGELLMKTTIEYPVADIEAVRIYWDEETQSVKMKKFPISDMYGNPSRESLKP